MIERGLRRLADALPTATVRAVGRWQFSGPRPVRPFVRAAARRIAGSAGHISRGPAAGLIFDAGGMNPGYLLGTTEPFVQEALVRSLRPGDVFYDIGAAAGFHSLLAARLVGEGGAVYAFEPAPASADLVERNARANGAGQIHLLRKAVSAAGGRGLLLVDEQSNHSRLVSGEGPSVVQVELASIDDLVAAGEIRPPNVVKIDVEGAELDVLEGMQRTIAEYRPVLLVELHWLGPTFVELAHRILDGYELTPLGDDPLFEIDQIAYGHVLATPR